MVNICFNAVIPFDYTVALYSMLYEMERDNFENNLDIEIEGCVYHCHVITYDKYCTDIKMSKYDCSEESLYGDKYYFKVLVEVPRSFIECNENNEPIGISNQLYDLCKIISEKYNFITITEDDIMDIVDQYILYRKSKDIKDDDNEKKMFFHTLSNKSIGIKKKNKKENMESKRTNSLDEKPIIDADEKYYQDMIKRQSKLKDIFTEEEEKKIKGDNEGDE